MKIVRYIVLEIAFVCFAILWGTMMTNDHQSGEICITPDWGTPINNYLEFGWNNYFHWFRVDENAPCRYTLSTLIFFYLFVLLFYSGTKSYGMKQCPVTLTWKIIVAELLIYTLLYMFFIMNQAGFIITVGSIFNALLGTVRFLMPIIIYGVMIGYIADSCQKY